MSENSILTTRDIAFLLQMPEITIADLVNAGNIPYNNLICAADSKPVIRFSENAVVSWVRNMADKKYLEKLREKIQRDYPEALAAIRELAAESAAAAPKRYALHKVKNKKLGFLWYVRYIENGKLVRSQWSSGVNDRARAEQWARENRERLLSEYHERKNNRDNFFSVLRRYYEAGSEYIQTDADRGFSLNEKTRKLYYNFINRTLIPFFKAKGIKNFSGITAPHIAGLQNQLLSKGSGAQTVNRYMRVFRHIIKHLIMKGLIADNVFDNVIMLKEKKGKRGCYDVEAIKGIFSRPWENAAPLSYILCLIIYSTDMRNCEIERMKLEDIIEIDGVHFVNVRKSKTENGLRLIPLHETVYKEILRHAENKKSGEFIFSKKGGPNQSTLYRQARRDMGAAAGYTEEELYELKISYYSGRHFWKTLMSAEGLGDVEEYFMGHKVSGSVANRYNHKDKQGRKRINEWVSNGTKSWKLKSGNLRK